MDDKEVAELPIMKYREEIIEKVRNNPITIIFGGETGCGKSTKIPQFILDDCCCQREECKILVTEPRKIAAMTLAKRVSREQKCELGSTVGYQIGLNKKADKEAHQTKLLYCTTGVLLEKIIYQKGIDSITHIILDEIHERDVDTDLTMLIIREYLLLGSNTKLILMSATLNKDLFSQYFTMTFNNKNYPPAVVSINSERKYSIDIGYLDDLQTKMSKDIINYSVPSITQEMYKLAATIIITHVEESSKSILVFLPGIYEIESAYSVLQNSKEIDGKCMIMVLHSSLPTEEQKEAFMPSTLPKIILSTNIAESSVTIPHVECIIDFCLTKNIVREGSSLSTLKMEFASRNSCVQRAGRTGRNCDGLVYRLIHRQMYNYSLLEENIPEMQRAPLENVVLRVKLLDIEAPVSFLSKSMSAPNRSSVIKSVLKLKELGGIKILEDDGSFNNSDGDITYVGKIMATLPIDVQLTKLIILGYMFSVLEETVIIAAGLNIKSIFQNHFNKKLEDYSARIGWANGSGCDSIAILNAYKFWKHEREKGIFRGYEDEQRWCNKYGLERKNLHEMRLLIVKIQDRLKEMKLEVPTEANVLAWSDKEKPLIIKICISGAFIPNFFIQGRSDETTEREVYKSLIGMDPTRTVYFRKMDRDQLGEIYAERVREKMVEYGIANDKHGIKVSFDCSKMFVQFANNTCMVDDEKYVNQYLGDDKFFPGCINSEVYKGVKFRKSGGKRNRKVDDQVDDFSHFSSFDLEVMSAQETREYADKYHVLEDSRDGWQIKKHYYSLPEYITFPSFNTKEMKGFIRSIDHCNKFHFQPIEDEYVLTFMIEKSLAEEANIVKAKNLKPNKLVVALHQKYHKRGRIEKVHTHVGKAQIFMIDYGYTVEIPFDDIFELQEDQLQYYFSISERCFECRLAEIVPSYAKCFRGKWTVESIEIFKQMTLNSFCTIQIYSFVEGVAAVELFISGQSINEYLIENGYARKCSEPLVSRLNHNERESVQSSVTPWCSRAVEFKETKSSIFNLSIPAPPLKMCKKIIKLDGPYSPLETELWEVSFKTRGTIRVEPQSVNSVLLDHEVGNYEGTLIVAADVMKNQNRGITLYNVTQLPKINALPTLLALIFTPNAIFYRSDDNSRFVGIRFGLGYHKQTFEAFHNSDDSYLPINYTEGFEQDLRDINKLRLYMSTLLLGDGQKTSASELSDEKKVEALSEIKMLMIEILNKKRYMIKDPPFFPENTGKWTTETPWEEKHIEDLYKAGPYRFLMLPKLEKKI